MIELTLPDMSCGHCEQAVIRTVRRVEPAASVQVDLATRKVRIEGARDAQALRDALAEEGYPAA